MLISAENVDKMVDKILTEAVDRLKAIEESDDPFCIGATGDTPTPGYTEINEVEDFGSTINRVMRGAFEELNGILQDSDLAIDAMQNWLSDAGSEHI